MDIIKDSDISFLSSKYSDAINKIDHSIYFTRDKIKSIMVNGEIYGQSNYTNISYEDLVKLRNDNELHTGALYKITNYVTTTSQSRTNSAGHVFDIIVMALSNNKLSEDAKACLHDGDTYFQYSNLSAWEIKYSLDNDTNRFTWASSSGKGVIYYMKDERGNVCHYDFKNIKFLEPNFGEYFYTFNLGNYIGKDYSIEAPKQGYLDMVCSNNIIEANYEYDPYTSAYTKLSLNNIVLITDESVCNEGCYNNKFGINCNNIVSTFLIRNCVFESNDSYIELPYIENSEFRNNVRGIIFDTFTVNNVLVETNNVSDGDRYYTFKSNNEINNLKILSNVVKYGGNVTVNVNTSGTYPTIIERGEDGEINIYYDLYGKIEKLSKDIEELSNTDEKEITVNTVDDNHANAYGYYGTLENYGLIGNNITIKKLYVTGRSDANEAYLYCKLLIKVNNRWIIKSVSNSAKNMKVAQNGNKIEFTMVEKSTIALSSKDNIAIVFYTDLTSLPGVCISTRFRTTNKFSGVLACNTQGQNYGTEIPLNPGVYNFAPAFSFVYTNKLYDLNVVHIDKDETINSVKRFNSYSYFDNHTYFNNYSYFNNSIILGGKTKILTSIDNSELKVFDNVTENKGFTIKTLSNTINGIHPVQILATDNSKSVQYTFPIKDIHGNNLPVNSSVNIITEKDITSESHDKAGIVYLKSYITDYNDLPNAYSKTALSLYGSYKMYTYIRGVIDENEEISSKSLVDLNERIESLTNLINQLQEQINELTINTAPEDVTYYGYQVVFDDVRIIETYGCTSVEDAELKAKEYIDDYSNAKREYGTYTIYIFSYDKNHKFTNVEDLEYAITTTSTSSTSTTSTTTGIIILTTTTTGAAYDYGTTTSSTTSSSTPTPTISDIPGLNVFPSDTFTNMPGLNVYTDNSDQSKALNSKLYNDGQQWRSNRILNRGESDTGQDEYTAIDALIIDNVIIDEYDDGYFYAIWVYTDRIILTGQINGDYGEILTIFSDGSVICNYEIITTTTSGKPVTTTTTDISTTTTMDPSTTTTDTTTLDPSTTTTDTTTLDPDATTTPTTSPTTTTSRKPVTTTTTDISTTTTTDTTTLDPDATTTTTMCPTISLYINLHDENNKLIKDYNLEGILENDGYVYDNINYCRGAIKYYVSPHYTIMPKLRSNYYFEPVDNMALDNISTENVCLYGDTCLWVASEPLTSSNEIGIYVDIYRKYSDTTTLITTETTTGTTTIGPSTTTTDTSTGTTTISPSTTPTTTEISSSTTSSAPGIKTMSLIIESGSGFENDIAITSHFSDNIIATPTGSSIPFKSDYIIFDTMVYFKTISGREIGMYNSDHSLETSGYHFRIQQYNNHIEVTPYSYNPLNDGIIKCYEVNSEYNYLMLCPPDKITTCPITSTTTKKP